MSDNGHTSFRFQTFTGRARSFPSTLFSLLLTVSLINAAQWFAHPETVAETIDASQQEVGDAVCRLAVGSKLVQELSGGGARTCTLLLNARQYFQFSLDKGDSNLSVSFYGPDGQPLLEYVTRRDEAVKLSLITEMAGRHRLEVRSLEQAAASRSYGLKVEALRDASKKDVKDASATKLFVEAHDMRWRWEETSLRRALEKFNQAALLWRAAGQPIQEINALMSAGEVHYILGEYRRALSLYEQASAECRSISTKEGEMQTLIQMARVYAYLGDNDKVEQYLSEVLRYCEQRGGAAQSAPERLLYASALTQLGEVSYSKGGIKRALELADRALALWPACDDRSGEAQAHLVLGYALTYSRDQDKALEQFNSARALYHEVGDERGEALSLTAVGSLHSLSGKEQQALEAHLGAMDIFRHIGDRQGEAVTLNGVGQVYEDLNERLTALDNYKQALKLFEANESPDFASVSEYQIANVYRALNDNQQALAHYKLCIALSRRTKKRRMEAYALNEMASIYGTEGRRSESLQQYYKILNLYQTVGDLRGQGTALNSLGAFYFSAGDKRRALGFYRQALPLVRTSGDRELETSTLYNMAAVERAAAAPDDALAHIEQALQLIETLRTFVASPDLRSSYFASVNKQYEFYIDLLMQLERERPGRGFAAKALLASEGARARSLLEILGEADTDIHHDVDEGLLREKQRLEQLLNEKAQSQVQLSSAKETQGKAAGVAREIRQLTAEYQLVQAKLREQNPRYATLTYPKPLKLEEIQAEIRDDDTIVLEYFLGEERSYLWVVSVDSFKSYELPARQMLEDKARELYELLTARQGSVGEMDEDYQGRIAAADRDYDEKSLTLSRLLLGPVASELGRKRLLVVTEGVLQYIPFEALPLPEAALKAETETPGEQGGTDDFVPLIARHEIVNLPSASTLAAIRRESHLADPAANVVAVLADPVFERNDPRVQGSDDGPPVEEAAAGQAAVAVRVLKDFATFNSTSHIPRLPYTLQETNAILALVPADKRMAAVGFAASRETAMNSQLGRYQIVHFATHGLIDDEHPELSGILLSLVNQKGEPENGFLQLHDIYNLKLSSKLVILSACNTGLGKDVKGEGLVGLTRGFMYAGSKSVVASLWKVDDRATSELMALFYRAMLKENLPPAAALRSAKEILRRQTAWRAPYFWAAFVLQGEYRETVQIPDTSLKVPYIIAAPTAVFVCLALLLYFKGRRKRARASAA